MSENNDTMPTERHGQHMIKEIFETPDCVYNILKKYFPIDNLFSFIPSGILQKIKKVVFIGSGTAYNAGLIGKTLIETVAGLRSDCVVASEFRYAKNTIDKSTLYVFISQSGETSDTIDCAKMVKKNSAKILSITNTPNSTLTKICNFVLLTDCGKELAIASTKAYVGQITIIYLLAFALLELKSYSKKPKIDSENNIKNIGTYDTAVATIKNIFSDSQLLFDIENQVKLLATKYSEVNKMYLLGRQLDHLTLVEAALKLKETTYLPCEAIPAGELKHGPISLIDQKALAICMCTQTELAEKIIPTVNDVKLYGGKTILIITDKKYAKNADSYIILPNFKNVFMPLISIIPLQILSYYFSLSLGNNPDKPRNLVKIVVD